MTESCTPIGEAADDMVTCRPMLALYILSLLASAGLTGLFVRQVVGGLGLVQGFEAEMMLATGAACAYISLQLLYVAFMKAIEPTRAGGPLFAEALSHLGAVALVPYLLGVRIAWPHPLLLKAEPLIYLGAFGAIHGLFKLVSFFAAIRGKASSRIWAFGWLLASGVAGYGAFELLDELAREATLTQLPPPALERVYRMGDVCALARPVSEGAVSACETEYYPGACLTMRWANVPGADEDPLLAEERIGRIYVTAQLEGGQASQWSSILNLEEGRWTRLRIPADRIPEGLRSCSVFWTSEKEPLWRRISGVRPMVKSHRRVLLSGPFQHEERGEDSEPNFLVLAIEGLGAEHLSCMGYKRDTTPALDVLAKKGAAWANVYTPAPESPAACMTLLTGTNPLAHGYLGARRGPLPEAYETVAGVLRGKHYATAAFTEGEGGAEAGLVFDGSLARGFEVLDSSYDYEAGSKATLNKIKSWINSHAGEKYMVFACLRELGDPRWSSRYEARGFAKDPAGATLLDVYDSALAYLDGEIGVLIDGVRAAKGGKRTCIIVTSPYGLDLSSETDGAPALGLTEDCLRVPLLMAGPGIEAGEPRDAVAGLEDVAPTLLGLAHTALDYVIDGKDLIEYDESREPISMFGAPMALSLRAGGWRFSWQSGRHAFVSGTQSAGDIIELYDVVKARGRRGKQNAVEEHPELAAQYRDLLQSYVERYGATWDVR